MSLLRKGLFFGLAFVRREVWLSLLRSVFALRKDSFWFSGIVPLCAALAALADVDRAPLFVVIDEGPTLPNQTLYANITVVDCILTVLAHPSIFVGISNHS